jgi:hypothetical protein
MGAETSKQPAVVQDGEWVGGFAFEKMSHRRIQSTAESRDLIAQAIG